MKKLFFVIVLFTIVMSCENHARHSKDAIEQEKEFVVKIKFKTNKFGQFKLVLYNITPKQSQNAWIQINQKVAATTAMDTLIANFGKNISNNFRIGFDNKNTRKIQFEWIRISYGEKAIVINPKELKKYFSMNEFIVQNQSSFKLETKKVDGKYNPQMFLKKEYLISLKKE